MGQPVPPPIPYTYWLLFEECSAKYIPKIKKKQVSLIYMNMKEKIGIQKLIMRKARIHAHVTTILAHSPINYICIFSSWMLTFDIPVICVSRLTGNTLLTGIHLTCPKHPSDVGMPFIKTFLYNGINERWTMEQHSFIGLIAIFFRHFLPPVGVSFP